MRPFVVTTCVAILLASPSALSHTHTAPDGSTVSWYPKECCHDRDCRPVAMVRPTNDGMWMTTLDGQTVLVGPDQHRRPSQDARWHICLGKGAFEEISVQCLFEPPSS